MSGQACRTRALVLQMCRAINDRDWELLPTFFAPESTWDVIVDTTRASYGGSMSAKARSATVKELCESFEVFSFTASSILVEGSSAAIEAEIKGKGPGNEEYENAYFMIIAVDEEGARIQSVRQALDPYRVEAWVASKGAR